MESLALLKLFCFFVLIWWIDFLSLIELPKLKELFFLSKPNTSDKTLEKSLLVASLMLDNWSSFVAPGNLRNGSLLVWGLVEVSLMINFFVFDCKLLSLIYL